MKRVVLSLVLIVWSTSLIATQSSTLLESNSIQGVVTRAGTNDPLGEVQIALEGAVAPETMERLLRDVATAGIVINPPAGASLSETTQLLISSAASRGLPIQAQGIQNLVTRSVGVQTWPTTVTDGSGRFVFRDVKPGRYTVRAIQDGYFGRPANGTYPPTAWTDVVVADQERKQVALSLVKGAIIGGRVFDASGELLSNAQVQVYSVGYQTGFAMLRPMIPGPVKTTDNLGEYRLFWIPPGDYYLGANPAAPTGGPGAPFQPGARTYYPSAARWSDSVPIAIRGGEDLRGMDITLRTVPLFRIAGAVTNTIPPPLDPNGGVSPATVFFHLANRDLETPIDGNTANAAGNIPLALPNGSFELSNVAPGSYEVMARVADPNAGTGIAAFSWGRAIVDVDDRDVRDVAITISPPVILRGTIRAAGIAALPGNLRVALTPMGGVTRINLYTLVTARPAPVGANGTFAVTSVPPGRFRIGAVAGLPADFYIADVRQSARSVFDEGFDIDSRDPDPVEIIVSNGAGVVDGIVQDGPVKPVEGAVVALVPESRRFENRALFASTTSDSSGHFTLRGVAPGDYRLFAWESTPPNAYQNEGFIRKYETSGRIIHVGQGTTVHAELTVIPAF